MRKLLLISLTALVAGSAAQAQMNTADLKWGPAPPGLPAGAQLAVLSGDPTKEGMFTIRLKFPANYAVPPHHHPSDELVTVIDGQTFVGMGDTLDKAKAATMNEAGYIAMPAKMNHYAFTTSGATIQITSRGPFQIIYVNPKDDPRNAAAAAPEKGR
jgi:quercetin dioxygenase-like cupin family protein